jgi:hypothetical protein
MRFVRFRLLAIVAICALLGSAIVANPSGAGTQVQGITDDEILIVTLTPDFDTLIAQGVIPAVSQFSTGNVVRRAQGYADLYGPIHGRKVVFKPAQWDPLDATDFDRACTVATQDNSPFMVLNGGGYRADSVACITVDNDTPMFFAESSYGAVLEASRKNLVTLGLPGEVNGSATAFFFDKSGVIPKSAKIGIVSENEPQRKAMAGALAQGMKKRGYDIVEQVVINSLQADNAATNRESAAAVGTLAQAGVDHVLVALAQPRQSGFWQEWNRTKPFKPFLTDSGPSTCTTFSAPRTPPEAEGIPCVTTYDTTAVATTDGIRQDNAFEAKCREQYEQVTGWDTYPGAQQGGTNVADQHWDEDIPYHECTMMSVLLPAIKAAGKNPTWEKVHKNILARTNTPMAYMSDGKGGYGKNKPYMADKIHMVSLHVASADTPKDANGLYNGCPLPINCWVPMEVDGQEWYPAKVASG